jgi:neural Wiskott-Aldrich syndrome protein
VAVWYWRGTTDIRSTDLLVGHSYGEHVRQQLRGEESLIQMEVENLRESFFKVNRLDLTKYTLVVLPFNQLVACSGVNNNTNNTKQQQQQQQQQVAAPPPRQLVRNSAVSTSFVQPTLPTSTAGSSQIDSFASAQAMSVLSGAPPVPARSASTANVTKMPRTTGPPPSLPPRSASEMDFDTLAHSKPAAAAAAAAAPEPPKRPQQPLPPIIAAPVPVATNTVTAPTNDEATTSTSTSTSTTTPNQVAYFAYPPFAGPGPKLTSASSVIADQEQAAAEEQPTTAPPPSTVAAAVAAPPPPPPPPPPPSAPTTAKPIVRTSKTSSTPPPKAKPSTDDLLEQIRKGRALKHIEVLSPEQRKAERQRRLEEGGLGTPTRGSAGTGAGGDMMGALANALAKRRAKIVVEIAANPYGDDDDSEEWD